MNSVAPEGIVGKLPSQAEFAAFERTFAPERFRSMAQEIIKDAFDARAKPFEAEEAAALLVKTWEAIREARREGWRTDPVIAWMHDQPSMLRVWDKLSGRRKKLRRTTPSPLDLTATANRTIELRRQWLANRANSSDRRRADEKYSCFWFELKARWQTDQMEWECGLARALKHYLHSNLATELIDERKRIEGLLQDALAGIDKVLAFLGTRLVADAKGQHNYPLLSERVVSVCRPGLEMLAKVDMSAFYPSSRMDTTARERQLVADLCDVNCSVFKKPKPEVIADVMTLPFIENLLDLRNIERLCKERREKLSVFSAGLREAKESIACGNHITAVNRREMSISCRGSC